MPDNKKIDDKKILVRQRFKEISKKIDIDVEIDLIENNENNENNEGNEGNDRLFDGLIIEVSSKYATSKDLIPTSMLEHKGDERYVELDNLIHAVISAVCK